MISHIQAPTLQICRTITPEQIRSCYPVIRQLRPHLTSQESFTAQVQQQIPQGYHLVYLQEDEEIKTVAGFRFLECLAWGKVLYLDDLITDSAARKKGYAGKMLKWLIEQAKLENCDQVHLDSGHHRHDAHRLYLNHGFQISCHHFELDLKQ